MDVKWCECSAVEKKWDDGIRRGNCGVASMYATLATLLPVINTLQC